MEQSITQYDKINMFIVSFQDKVIKMLPFPKPTDDKQETLQMMIDPVERFFAEKGTKFFETSKNSPVSCLAFIRNWQTQIFAGFFQYISILQYALYSS